MDESRDTPMPASTADAPADSNPGMAPATALPSPRFAVPGLAPVPLNPFSPPPPPMVAAPAGLPVEPSAAPQQLSSSANFEPPPTGSQPPNAGIPVVSTSAGGFKGGAMTAPAAPPSDGFLVPRVPRVESSLAGANNSHSHASGQGHHPHHQHPGAVVSGADPASRLAPSADQSSGAAAAAAGKRTSELKVEDALKYLDEVKREFEHNAKVYNEFLDIMKKFKTHAIDTPGVMEHVSKLFRGNNRLILGFNTFLPDGYKIDLQSIEESNRRADLMAAQQKQQQRALQQQQRQFNRAQEQQQQPMHSQQQQQPQSRGGRGGGGRGDQMARMQQQRSPGGRGGGGSGELIGGGGGVGPGGVLGSPLSGAATAVNGRASAAQAEAAARAAAAAAAAQAAANAAAAAAGGGGEQHEFKRAINYVTKIKNRFNDDQDTYKRFLEILHTYQKEQKSSGIEEVLEHVSHLFADHTDLLMEFTYFLPDNVQEQAKDRLHEYRVRVQEEHARKLLEQHHLAQQQQQQQQLGAQATSGGRYAPSGGGRGGGGGYGGRASGTNGQAYSQAGGYGGGRGSSSYGGGRGGRGTGGARRKGQQQQQPMQGGQAGAGMRTAGAAAAGGSGGGAGSSGYVSHAAEVRRYNALAHSDMGGGGALYFERLTLERIKDTLGTGTKNDLWNEFLRACEAFGCGATSKAHLCDVAADCLGIKSPDLLRDFKELLARRSGETTVAADMSNHARPLAEIDFHACERITPTYRKLPADYFDPSYASRRPEEAQFLCDHLVKKVSVALGAEDAGAVGTFKHMRKNEYEEKLFKTEDERFEVDMLIDSTKTAVAALQKLQIEVDALALLASGDGGITLAAVDRDNSSGNSSIQPTFSSSAFSSSVLSVTSPSNASSSSSDDVASTFRGYEVEELCGGGLKNAVHYKLDSTALNTVHKFAIARLYGDSSSDVLQKLYSSPAATIPVVLARLEQKVDEWTRARSEMQATKRWREENDKSWARSLDHRAFYFARAEKRKVTSNKWLLDEIKDLRADHDRAADHAAEKAQAAEEAANKAAEVAASASASATAAADTAASTTASGNASSGASALSVSSVPGGLAAPTTRAAQSEGYGAAAAAAAAAAAGRAAKAAAKKADERTKRGAGPNRALVAGDTFVGTIVLGPPPWWTAMSPSSNESSDGDTSSGGGATNDSGSSSSGGAVATNAGGASASGAGSSSSGGANGSARSKESQATGAAMAGLALPGTQRFGVGCAPYSVEAGYAPLPPPKFNPDHVCFDVNGQSAPDLSLPPSSSSSSSSSSPSPSPLSSTAVVPYGDPQLFLQYNDRKVHRDAYRLLVYALEHCGFPLAGVNDTREASLRAWRHTLAPLLHMPPEWLAETGDSSTGSSGGIGRSKTSSNRTFSSSSPSMDGVQVVAALCPGCSPATAQVLAEAVHARAILAHAPEGGSGNNSGVSAAAAAAAASGNGGAMDAADLEYAKLMGDDLQTLEALPFPTGAEVETVFGRGVVLSCPGEAAVPEAGAVVEPSLAVAMTICYEVALACGVVAHIHPSALLYHLDHVWPEASTLLPSLQSSSDSSSIGNGADASSSLSAQEPKAMELTSSQTSSSGEEATSTAATDPSSAAATLVLQRVPWCSSALAEVGPPEEALGLLEAFPNLFNGNDAATTAAGGGGAGAEEARGSKSGDVSNAIRAMALELAASSSGASCNNSSNSSGVVYGTQSLYLMLRTHQALVNRLVRAKELCYSKTANRESVFAQAVFLASGKDPVEPGVRSNNGSSSVSGSSSGETAKAAALPPPPPPSRRSAPGLPLIPPLPPPIKEPVSTYAPVPGLEGDSEEEEAKEGDVASGGGGGDVSLRADDVIVNQDDVSMMELLGGMGHASYGAFLQQVESVLDGSTEMTKFEEASRVLLGNRGYVCFTIDKVVTQCAKHLMAVASDPLLPRLAGLQRAHRLARAHVRATTSAAAAGADASAASAVTASSSSLSSNPTEAELLAERRDVHKWVENAYDVPLGSPDGGAPDVYAFQSFAGAAGGGGGGGVGVEASGDGDGVGATSQKKKLPLSSTVLPPAALGCGPESGLSRSTRANGLVMCIELLGPDLPPSPQPPVGTSSSSAEAATAGSGESKSANHASGEADAVSAASGSDAPITADAAAPTTSMSEEADEEATNGQSSASKRTASGDGDISESEAEKDEPTKRLRVE